jgi:hypothetical protein
VKRIGRPGWDGRTQGGNARGATWRPGGELGGRQNAAATEKMKSRDVDPSRSFAVCWPMKAPLAKGGRAQPGSYCPKVGALLRRFRCEQRQ